MASGYSEEFFYSSTPERNLKLPPPYGEFIFRPPTRRQGVKSSKSFKDQKTKNKGRGPPSRMYATVRDPRIAPGYPLIHPDFITPQQFIPNIVPPEPRPIKPARSKSFNNNKKTEQRNKLKDPPPFMTYRCQSYPGDESEDQGLSYSVVPHRLLSQSKQRLGLHEELFCPPSSPNSGPSSPAYDQVSPERDLPSPKDPFKVNYSGMYVPSNELENSLTLKELNETEVVVSPKPQKKKSAVRQILSSLFSSKKPSEQTHSKNERKIKTEVTKSAKPVTVRTVSSEMIQEQANDEKTEGSSVESEEAQQQASKRGSRPSAKVLHQNDQQDQIIEELKKKNSLTRKEDSLDIQEIPGLSPRSEEASEADAGVGGLSRKSENLETSRALQQKQDQAEGIKKSKSVPSDLAKGQSGPCAKY